MSQHHPGHTEEAYPVHSAQGAFSQRPRVQDLGSVGVERQGEGNLYQSTGLGRCSQQAYIEAGYVCMHTVRAYMHTCIHAYMHTCIHAYMHTCIHAIGVNLSERKSRTERTKKRKKRELVFFLTTRGRTL